VKESFDEARKLLAEAGYPGGQGLPQVEIICYEDEVKLKSLEAIQAEWRRELHIAVTIAQQEQKTLFANEQQGNFRLGYGGWQADYVDPLTFLETLETGNGNNWSFWSNPEFDRLIEETRHTADNARRMALFQQAEAIVVDECPILPLNFRPNIYARRPEVRGWTTTVVGMHEYNKMWLER
jgi:oligopeptide transport system substrate-binding protein